MTSLRSLAPALVLTMAFPTFGVSGSKSYRCTMGVQDCLDAMVADLTKRGWIGIEIDVDEETGRRRVRRVVPGSPAEAAGMKAGDVLVAIDGIRYAAENEERLKKAHAGLKPGARMTYLVGRAGAEVELKLVLAPIPSDVLAQWIGMHMLEHVTPEPAPPAP